jgi:hypothetical protein
VEPDGPTRVEEPDRKSEDRAMSIGTILLIILILLLIGAIPAWPHSIAWGYWPSGIVGLILIVVVILVLTGRF